MGRMAFTTLIDKIAGQPDDQSAHHVMPPELVVRRTTRDVSGA
jgi:DNA-binding LacI/PurR family transcriptional regulator